MTSTPMRIGLVLTACAALGPHIYGAGWLAIPQRELLNRCAALAGHTRVCEVWLPEDPERIRSSARFIAADFGSRASSDGR